MFVKQNNLAGIKNYFFEKLSDDFSESELRLMFRVFVGKRMSLPESEVAFARELRFSESDLLYFRNVIKELKKGKPFQYIIGDTEFYGVKLKIDERALIPRPETEELVDWILKDIDKNKSYQIADLCSGSGCIAFALKKHLPNSQILALEYDLKALSLIQENKILTNINIKIWQCDVLSTLTNCIDQKEFFDIWVSNPPYIPKREAEMMDRNVLDYEPTIALFVENEDPLLFYRKIIQKAEKYLKKTGKLYFEVHERKAKEVEMLFKNRNWEYVEIKKDLQGKERMVVGQRLKEKQNH